jgi:branched-chain amino acid transport system ATP-binding protein
MTAASQQTTLAGVLGIVDLSVGYGGRTVIADLDFSVSRGETLAFLGINGAGKSTTLKGIAGALRPAKGTVLLDGHNVTGRTPAQNARTGLLLVPEGARSFHALTVRENLEMGGFVIGDSAKLRERLEETLEWFPRLRERGSLRAGSLSGGERQMLGIARALMLRPKVLLLDEPLLGLAPIMIAEVKSLVKRVQSETNCAIVIAEQQVGSILPICDRAFVLHGGHATPIDPRQMLQASEKEQAAILFGV